MTVLQPGVVVGERYRVERELAKGGYGAVYVAQHRVTEELVALKVLWPHVLKSRDAVTRFQFEATVAAKIGSENIVRVLDAGFDEGLQMPFLIMELLKGKTLEAMVEQEGPMEPLEALSVLSQTANALDKAHAYVDKEGKARPIIHRDLKPENLFFARRESGEPCIKVLDFGIAKVLSETAKVSQEVKGTPLYMSHEQLIAQPIGPASDVWALGLIAFFLMSGKSYWLAAANPDSSINALFAEILGAPTASASARARALGVTPPWPSSFDGWFARCVDRDPASRFQRAGEAIAELSAVLSVVDSSPESPVLAKARTMLAMRYHLSQVATAPTAASPVPDAPVLAVSAGASLGGLSRGEGTHAPTNESRGVPAVAGGSRGATHLVGASLTLAFVAIGTLVFVVARTPPMAVREGAATSHTPMQADPTAVASTVAAAPSSSSPAQPAVKPTSGGKTTATTKGTSSVLATGAAGAPAAPPDKGKTPPRPPDPFGER